MHLTRVFQPGDLVWFDPGVGYVLPGEVVEFHRAAQVITVQAVINNVTKTFTLNNLSSVSHHFNAFYTRGRMRFVSL